MGPRRVGLEADAVAGAAMRAPPSNSSCQATPSGTAWTGRKFIAGEPMKPATKRFAGSSYSCSGLPICATWPAFITTMRSAIVIASI